MPLRDILNVDLSDALLLTTTLYFLLGEKKPERRMPAESAVLVTQCVAELSRMPKSWVKEIAAGLADEMLV